MEDEGARAKCAVCGRIRADGRWFHPAKPHPEWIYSHGYCPVCFQAFMAKIARIPTVGRAVNH
ncbi:MAG: hypothetical protein HN742_25900 [Lentisphaerae bacterium]|nr:hypothetical protein [Lentisphaerota bacterium]MBT4818525.1 hypothetical protein [Lentisphaerota bacterium]MBT5606523.1 hypothetical protein [Lentisphaerota bacterium]MBT7060146.1 hypothetical protein [Lentisphaerota bacterium]MBT7845335.1 hypothetical protein [Lentisphaerota bacterium]